MNKLKREINEWRRAPKEAAQILVFVAVCAACFAYPFLRS